MTRPTKSIAVSPPGDFYPPLPLEPPHWQAVVRAMRLSPRQSKVVELLLRGMCDKQIAVTMGISEPTIRTYLDRIWARTRSHGRMELAMRVLAVSHEVIRDAGCPRK
jgi:DNA-binding NarL/FixJ family response regulator